MPSPVPCPACPATSAVGWSASTAPRSPPGPARWIPPGCPPRCARWATASPATPDARDGSGNARTAACAPGSTATRRWSAGPDPTIRRSGSACSNGSTAPSTNCSTTACPMTAPRIPPSDRTSSAPMPSRTWCSAPASPAPAVDAAFRRGPGRRRWAWDPGALARSLRRPARLDLGRSVRVASHAQRIALRVMHPRCGVPTCTVRFEHTAPHHVRWWDRDHGRTDLGNLEPLYSGHHHDVHDRAWALTVASDRHVEIRLPDGRLLLGPPPRVHHDRLRQRRARRRTGADDTAEANDTAAPSDAEETA